MPNLDGTGPKGTYKNCAQQEATRCGRRGRGLGRVKRTFCEATTPEEQLKTLEDDAAFLEKRLEETRKRISDLKKE